MTPVLILDLAPKFNIPQNQINLYDEYINNIKSKLNVINDVLYIYEEEITKKITVEEDEDSYNNILRVTRNIINIMNKTNNDNIIIAHLGKFSEYNYVFSFLNLEATHCFNIHRAYIRHPSYYIEDTGIIKKEKMFNKDLNKIINYKNFD